MNEARVQLFQEIYDNWDNIPLNVRSQLNDSRDQALQWRNITQNTINDITQLNSQGIPAIYPAPY